MLRALRTVLAVVIAIQVGMLGAELIGYAQSGGREPADAAASTRAGPPSSGTERSSPEGLPSWVIAAASVTGAAVAVAQWRRRRRHSTIPSADGPRSPVSAAEVGATLGEDALVGAAMRALHDRLRIPVASVPLALHASEEVVEVFWDRPPPPVRKPWRRTRSGWVWEARVTDLVVFQPCDRVTGVLPALVLAGATGFGDLHLNLEAFEVMSLVGDDRDTSRFARHLVSALTGSGLEVWTVGARSVGLVGRSTGVRPVELETALIEARRRRAVLHRELDGRVASVLDARLTEGADRVVLRPLFVVVAADGVADRQFEVLVRAARGRAGVTCIVVGHPVSDAVEFTCAAGAVGVPFLGEIAVVLPDVDAEPDTLVMQPVSALPPTESPGPDIATEPDHEPVTSATPGIEVRVLGPVEIVGTKGPLAGKSTELVAYLACHPEGVSDDRIKTALWPDRAPHRQTWRNRLTACRHALGTGPDGELVLPHFDGALGRLASSVTTDLARLAAVLKQARSQDPPTAMATLRVGLELVRGRPFEESHGYDWAFSDLHVAEAERVVTDVAHLLAELALTAGDWRLALWATERGIRACPTSEQLAQDRMRAFYAAGDLSGVEAAMRDLRVALEADDPARSLHPDTHEVFARLSHRASSS